MKQHETSSITAFNQAVFDKILARLKDIVDSRPHSEDIVFAWEKVVAALKDQDMSLVLYSFRVFLLAATSAGVDKDALAELEDNSTSLRQAWLDLSDSSRVSVFIYLQPVLLKIYIENINHAVA